MDATAAPAQDLDDRSLGSERAYQYIRDSIYLGRFKPGQIVTAGEVAGVVGVSRTPVREAMQRASADGLIELEGFRRARVSSFSDADTNDLFEIRAVLEAIVAERASTQISEEEIDRLAALTDALEEATRTAEPELFRQFADFNSAFHTVILKAARSRQLTLVLEHLIETPLILHKRFEGTLRVNLERAISHHREIIAAFRARDPKWARATMTAHLMSARSSPL
ncbi:MAG: hypothetical protein A3H35_04735 [Betaproteobacteria bacterium RIFCSPLOWO2_02_FULL_62_17]|nr:MAG: hypothetical protein A3H35_04735 [Betaproteobacteria bacterium RIFCSPLOWO2_02_FULL_62_17]